MKLTDIIKTFIQKRRCTMIGIGPMSISCIDAAVEIANENDIPLFLIASRRQIDSEEFGGGYVNNWTTNEYSRYVRSRDLKGKVILARDHGGPWQSNQEKENNLSLPTAMDSAKRSYKADIDADIKMLHIDPSIDIHGNPSQEELIDRACELIEYCWQYSKASGKEIAFEIGTEEQSGSVEGLEVLEHTLQGISKFCEINAIAKPVFVVAQCGTKVVENRNVGCFQIPMRIEDEIPVEIQLPLILRLCNRFGILMKEHNADYLNDDSLRWHPKLGIHAANVAPEFGVTETRALLNLLETMGQNRLAEKLLSIFFDSRYWEKWVLPQSCCTDHEKAIFAGHYCFSLKEVQDLKKEACGIMLKKGVDLDLFLKDSVKESIFRYIRLFGLVR